MAHARALKSKPLVPQGAIATVSRSFEDRKDHIIQTLCGLYVEGGPPAWKCCPFGQTCSQPFIVWVLNNQVEGIYLHDRLKFLFVKENVPDDICPEWWAVDMLNNPSFACISYGEVFAEIQHLSNARRFDWYKFV